MNLREQAVNDIAAMVSATHPDDVAYIEYDLNRWLDWLEEHADDIAQAVYSGPGTIDADRADSAAEILNMVAVLRDGQETP